MISVFAPTVFAPQQVVDLRLCGATHLPSYPRHTILLVGPIAFVTFRGASRDDGCDGRGMKPWFGRVSVAPLLVG